GRGRGGIVRITTRPLPESGIHGFAGADFLDASGMLSASFGPSVRAAVGARYGYLDASLRAVDAPHDLNELVAIPRYADGQAKVSWRLRRGEQLSALFLASTDSLRYSVAADGFPGGTAHASSDSFQRFALEYVRVPDARTRLTATPFYGFDRDDETTVVAGEPTRLAMRSVRYGVRADREQRFGEVVTLTTGAD